MSAFALAAALVGVGCVTSGTYEGALAERDALDQEKQALETQLDLVRTGNESLAQELEALIDELENERISRSGLESRVAKLSEAEEKLSEELSVTSSELVRSQEELAKTAAEVEALNSTYVNLVNDLESELASGQIQIEQLKEGLRVNVSDDVLFASGSATLDGTGRTVLEKVAHQLAGLDHNIEVQGHTDNIPIRGRLTKTFPTNWELAAARAARVARLLQEQGVSGDRLIVASFAEFKPLAPNDSDDGRAMNRRIEIRLLPINSPVGDDMASSLDGAPGKATGGAPVAAPAAAP